MVLDKVLKFVITALMAIIGLVLMNLLSPYLKTIISAEFLSMGIFGVAMTTVLSVLLGGVIGGIIGLLTAPFLIKHLLLFSLWVENQLNKMPFHEVIAGAGGLAIGLVIANLLGSAFSQIPIIGNYVPVIFSIIFGYLGINITIKKRNEISALFDSFNKNKEKQKDKKNNEQYKILDTSVIIDGRIADICKTGFIEGTILIPIFVLEELQHIADSSDALKRNRGRLGLDVLNNIQKELGMHVKIDNRDFDDINEVDSKLVRLGKLINGKIITNDYNLNKVSEIQGVSVLNINELSNTVKPVVIPGEEMTVFVVKDGKEPGQGVAYLDDGTMIVVEDGRSAVGETIDVVVTSVLQTAAGRMIFAKCKN